MCCELSRGKSAGCEMGGDGGGGKVKVKKGILPGTGVGEERRGQEGIRQYFDPLYLTLPVPKL